MYNVSLEYLLLFNTDKSSGYCGDGNLLTIQHQLACKLHILYYCNAFGNLLFGEEREGKMALPMPYIINCDMILGSYI